MKVDEGAIGSETSACTSLKVDRNLLNSHFDSYRLALDGHCMAAVDLSSIWAGADGVTSSLLTLPGDAQFALLHVKMMRDASCRLMQRDPFAPDTPLCHFISICANVDDNLSKASSSSVVQLNECKINNSNCTTEAPIGSVVWRGRLSTRSDSQMTKLSGYTYPPSFLMASDDVCLVSDGRLVQFLKTGVRPTVADKNDNSKTVKSSWASIGQPFDLFDAIGCPLPTVLESATVTASKQQQEGQKHKEGVMRVDFCVRYIVDGDAGSHDVQVGNGSTACPMRSTFATCLAWFTVEFDHCASSDALPRLINSRRFRLADGCGVEFVQLFSATAPDHDCALSSVHLCVATHSVHIIDDDVADEVSASAVSVDERVNGSELDEASNDRIASPTAEREDDNASDGVAMYAQALHTVNAMTGIEACDVAADIDDDDEGHESRDSLAIYVVVDNAFARQHQQQKRHIAPTFHFDVSETWMFNTWWRDTSFASGPALTPAICTRHDVDSIVWAPRFVAGAADAGERSMLPSLTFEHVATFPALGYVQASKTQRKMSVSPADGAFGALVDTHRHIYVYRQPSSLDGGQELRNRTTGKRTMCVAKQVVVNVDADDDHGPISNGGGRSAGAICGAVAFENNLMLVMTETRMVVIRLT